MLLDAPFNQITSRIIAAAIEVHRVLGPGLLESTYAMCLEHELASAHIRFATQRSIPIVYKGVMLDCQYRVDLIVEGQVIVEIKSIERMLAVHKAQVITYLRLTGCPVGLLINFNSPKLVDGVARVLNRLLRAVTD
jgi:GxxExxY protein